MGRFKRLFRVWDISRCVYLSSLSYVLSDGNDKIEERVKEKQKKDKEHQKPPNRKKKVDLTFDYDPEKECE